MKLFESLRAILHRKTDLTEELEAHLRMAIADRVAQGESPTEARRAALREFGNLPLVADVTRERWGGLWLERLSADISFGWRQLRKRKVTTAAAVLSLGLAIGSCMAAFRLVDALFLRPLSVAHPERLYEVQFSGLSETGQAQLSDQSTYPIFTRMRDEVKGQANLVGVSTQWNDDITFDGAGVEKAHQQFVSGGMFSAFGLKPAAGRLFNEGDDQTPKAKPVAVLSYDFWTSHLGSDPHAVGRTFRMGDVVYEVVGVAPKGFRGTGPGVVTDIYLPTMMNEMVTEPDAFWFRVFVVVNPGTQLEPLMSRLETANHLARLETTQEMVKVFPNAPKSLIEGFLNPKVDLQPCTSGVSTLQKDYRIPLLILSVLVGLVLLIACVNVANLMAGQAASRAREMAVRVSLGAGRGRLIRLVMVESTMVGAASATFGILFNWWATPFVVSRIHPATEPVPLWIGPDWMVMVFGVALTMGATLLFGLIPALRASRVQPVNALKSGMETQGRVKWMQGMIAAQVAFCTLVLFASALFVGTLLRLQNKPLGLQLDRLVVINAVSHEPMSPTRWQQIAERLQQTPGVEKVALETMPVLSGGWESRLISVNGGAWAKTPVSVLRISPGWFETMHIPLKDGRDLRSEDVVPGSVVINETLAKMFFAGVNPIGHIIHVPAGDAPGNFQIVGVVADSAYKSLREAVQPGLYMPLRSYDAKTGTLAPSRYLSLEVKTKEAPESMMQTLRLAMKQIDSNVVPTEMQPHQSLVQNQLLRERLLATLGGFFAVVALLLAAIGLYGVLHYSVVQREKEIGIRIALGAAATNIARIVTVRVSTMVFAGMIAGLAAGVASMRFVETLLYGVKATDLSMLLLPGLVLLTAAALASLPAVFRAVRIDPVRMLRSE